MHCVLLSLQTNGGEVEAQKFLLGSPERGVCVCSVMWEKSLCICCIVTSYQSDLQQEVWDEYNFYVRESDGAPASLWIKDLHLPFICKMCFPWPPPPIFIRGWKKKCKNSLWTWPKQKVQPEILAIQNALWQGGGKRGVWKDMPEITEAIGGGLRKLLPSHLKHHFKPMFRICIVSLFTAQILNKWSQKRMEI